MIRTVSCWIVIWVTVSASSAQEVDAKGPATPTSAAERWLRDGVELRRRGADAEAYSLFQRAAAATNWPRALAQLGLVEQALGRWLEADEHLRVALASADDPWIAAHRQPLATAARYVGEHIATLEIEGTAGATITVDGQPVGTLPLKMALRVLAGDLKVGAQLEGVPAVTRALSLSGGGIYHERFELPRPKDLVPGRVPVLQARPETTHASAHASTASLASTRIAKRPVYKRPWFWSVLVGATVVVAVGIGVGVGLTRANSSNNLPGVIF